MNYNLEEINSILEIKIKLNLIDKNLQRLLFFYPNNKLNFHDVELNRLRNIPQRFFIHSLK